MLDLQLWKPLATRAGSDIIVRRGDAFPADAPKAIRFRLRRVGQLRQSKGYSKNNLLESPEWRTEDMSLVIKGGLHCFKLIPEQRVHAWLHLRFSDCLEKCHICSQGPIYVCTRNDALKASCESTA